VRLVLNMMADMKLPPIEPLGTQGARAFATQLNAARPAGRPVGEVVDGTLQGADGSLPYRLYRPATPGRIRLWSTSMVADGCWVISSRTIHSAVTCVGVPE
jgi:hypothetical protein